MQYEDEKLIKEYKKIPFTDEGCNLLIMIAEVKWNPRNYIHKLFMEKVEHLRQKEMTKYTLETKLFSLEDM